jgi:predicted ATPase/DNA-binding CsgD family transcriptional regulator
VELASLDDALTAASRGDPQIVRLCGDAGIGKSRLVAEVETRAREAGFLVLDVACVEFDRAVPYAPFVDLLRAQAHPIPELVDSLSPTSTRGAVQQPERHEVFHAIREFLVGCARAQPTLLVLEDLHWCDTTTLQLILFLARRLADQPLLILLSYRAEEPHPDLGHFLAELDRQRLATELTLTPLSRGQVEQMVRALLPPHRPLRGGFLNSIYTLTEGNPFFVEEVLAAIARDEEHDGAAWDRVSLESLRITRSIEDTVVRRLVRVSPAAQRVIRLAAVAGRQFDFSLLQALSGEDESILLHLLAELVREQLIVEDSAERFRFRHALTRHAIYQQLLTRERQGLHRVIAQALERGERDAHLADLAYHHYQARNWPEVLLYAPRMGERAQLLQAPEAAIEHFSHALEAAEALGEVPPADLLRSRAHAYEMHGDFAEAQADYSRALDLAGLVGDRSATWQILLEFGFLWLARDLETAGRCFRSALELAEAMGDAERIAHSQNRLGNWFVNLDQPEASANLHRQALASFEALGDQAGVAQTRDLLALATYIAGDRSGAIARLEEAAADFEALNDRRGLASVLATLAHLRCSTHVYDTLVGAAAASPRALHEAETALELARAIGWRAGEAYATCELAACLSAEGECGRALAAVAAGQATAAEIEHRGWLTVAHATRGFVELDLLDASAARADFQFAESQARQAGSIHLYGVSVALLALACLGHRDVRQAEALLVEAVAPEAPVSTLTQSLLLAAFGEVRLAQGEFEVALELAERLIAWAEATGGGPGVAPRLEKLRGEALAGLGQHPEAERSLRLAAEAAQTHANRPLLWRIHLSLGNLLRAVGRRAEAERSYASARDVVSVVAASLPDELAAVFKARALSLMPQPPALTPLRAARQASGGLTARERQVVALTGRGLSNSQIAEQLVVSERTVESHMGRIREKLGVSSRSQLAAWAIGNGLVQARGSD